MPRKKKKKREVEKRKRKRVDGGLAAPRAQFVDFGRCIITCVSRQQFNPFRLEAILPDFRPISFFMLCFYFFESVSPPSVSLESASRAASLLPVKGWACD